MSRFPLLMALGVATAFGASAASADQRTASAIWTCEPQRVARLDLTMLSITDAGERVAPLSMVAEPFTCELPWGRLEVEVVGYNSPNDSQSCGLAEAWGLRVVADGKVLLDVPADSARSCFDEDFDPFLGWIEADDERVHVCRTAFETLGSQSQRCTSAWAPEF